MKTKRFFSMLLGAVICAMPLFAGLPVSAETDDFYNDPDTDVEEETFTSGDYTYSIMTGAEDASLKAACLETYTGSESDLVIPSEIDGYEVVSLGDRTFMTNSFLNTVTIPASLIGTGLYSFYGCTNLKDFIVAEDNPYFYAVDGVLYAEEGNGYLVQYPIGRMPVNIEIPEGVYDIGNSAFAECISLESVTFPESLKFIGVWAFAGCHSLDNISIPKSVTELEDFSFYNCAKLSNVQLPNTITSIGAGTFARCPQLTKFTIPSSCTTIGESAFAVTGLTEIDIPSTVTSIGYSAFGFMLNADEELVAQDNFVIRGVAGSEAEAYINDEDNENDFTFEAVEPTVTGTDHQFEMNQVLNESSDKKDSKDFGALRIVILSVIGVAILALIVLGIAYAVRKHPQEEAESADEAPAPEEVPEAAIEVEADSQTEEPAEETAQTKE